LFVVFLEYGMEWILIAIALGVAFHFWRRLNRCKDLAPRLAITVAANCEMILATYRREIANYLMQRDPDRFLNLYRRARAAESAVEAGSEEDREARFAFITNRYPFYSDFDLVGALEHVPYAEALSGYRLEDIEEHYLRLVKYHALRRALDPDWRFRGRATTNLKLEHLQAYVQKIKNKQCKTAPIRDQAQVSLEA
jgi:hypothetical protein